MSAMLISIICPPAVGKTTLAQALAEEMPGRLVLEDYRGNPFLAESYTGQAEARLPGQMYFLVSRVAQLCRLSWPAEGCVVSDYGFCQDRIYARLRLSADDYAAYDQVASRVEALVHPPDVTIALDAGVQTLLARVARRGRDYERVFNRAFLENLRSAYELAIRRDDPRVIWVDCDAVDLREPTHRARLARMCQELAGGCCVRTGKTGRSG